MPDKNKNGTKKKQSHIQKKNKYGKISSTKYRDNQNERPKVYVETHQIQRHLTVSEHGIK